MPDLIFYNGNIQTMDPHQPHASALAIRGNRILAVGSDENVRDLAGRLARPVDLEGRLVLPGLTDSHFHLYDWSLSRSELQLADTTSLQDLQTRLAQRIAEFPAGNWIKGQGWNETRWEHAILPTATELDAVSKNHPVILWRSDLHLAVANSRALELAGITSSTPNPPEGLIDRDPSGQPSGILRELAINLVRNVIPPPDERETSMAIRSSLPELHRLGLTGVHDFRIMGGADGPPAFHAYQRLNTSGELVLRVWMDLPGERLEEAISLGLRSGFGDNTLRIGHVKFFSDGSQGARTAWMLEPYEDTEQYGIPLTPMDQISRDVQRADRAGLATAVHAIGDRANRELIDVFEEVLNARSSDYIRPSVPHRIEHVQNIRPEDVHRLAELGVVASVQPIHATDDINVIERSVGTRGRFSYPFRDMLDAGVLMTMGSDAPVASPNPMWGIHAAVTRQRRNGTPSGGWYPRQRISVTEAVWGYTTGPALVSGRNTQLGSLTPGKLADLIVLDRDIYKISPSEIAQAQVAVTVFDGKVVHET